MHILHVYANCYKVFLILALISLTRFFKKKNNTKTAANFSNVL